MQEREQFAEVRRIFEAALELGPEDRVRFIDSETDDAAIREAVRTLLARSSDETRDDLGGLPPVGSVWAQNGLPPSPPGFQLVRRIGEGGMGVVYEAIQDNSNRKVALKVLSDHLLHEPEALARFEREAKLAASINHPRCVYVYGATEVAGRPAIAMELMTERTLADEMKAGTIPVDQALRWTDDVLAGLEAAHNTGILHRDVKPHNCFIDAAGHARVGDFGLSKSREAVSEITRAGAFFGTPSFASPEQIRGEAVDVRSDVYSVGATAYALLTGHPPFEEADLGALLGRVLADDPPPVRRERPEVPRHIDRAIARMLSRDPNRRPPDHGSSRRLLRVSSPPGRAATPFQRTGAVVVDLLALFLISAFLGGVWHPANAWVSIVAPLAYLLGLSAWNGATLGQRAFGITVRNNEGKHAPLAAALRTALWWVPCFLFRHTIETANGSIGFPSPIVLLAWVGASPRNGWRSLIERVTRMHVERTPRGALAPAVPDMPKLPGEIEPPVGFSDVRVFSPSPAGTWTEANDEKLRRSVWLHISARPCESMEPVAEADLRWHERFEGDSGTVDVFEAPGGASLLAYRSLGATAPWRVVRNALVDLVDGKLGDPVRVDLNALWLDASGTLRRLPTSCAPATRQSTSLGETLSDVSSCLTIGARGRRTRMPSIARRVIDRFTSADSDQSLIERVRALPIQPETGRLARVLPAFVSLVLALGIGMSLRQTESGASSAVPLTILVAGNAILVWCLRLDLLMDAFGLQVVDASGHPASRTRLSWRALLALAPFLLLPRFFAPIELIASLAIGWTALLITPSRGLHDRLTGCWVVPKEAKGER